MPKTKTTSKVSGRIKGGGRRAAWRVDAIEALDLLVVDPSAEFFTDPVDPVALGIEDYPLVIQTPMDLGTVQENLVRRKYKNMEELIEDIELVFINAKTYNARENHVHIAAMQCEQEFQRLFHPLVSKHCIQRAQRKWKMINQPGGFKWGLHRSRRPAKDKRAAD